jgi:hypothetical protein
MQTEWKRHLIDAKFRTFSKFYCITKIGDCYAVLWTVKLGRRMYTKEKKFICKKFSIPGVTIYGLEQCTSLQYNTRTCKGVPLVSPPVSSDLILFYCSYSIHIHYSLRSQKATYADPVILLFKLVLFIFCKNMLIILREYTQCLISLLLNYFHPYFIKISCNPLHVYPNRYFRTVIK